MSEHGLSICLFSPQRLLLGKLVSALTFLALGDEGLAMEGRHLRGVDYLLFPSLQALCLAQCPPKSPWLWGLRYLNGGLMQVGCQKYENDLNNSTLAASISPIDGLNPATPG
ncbi:hypothetical protein CFAM422_012107 [Trichoderma lentiforme]|uniref:Uncharacterized protein n=1 Tax=Trichoderma lentiforme TaxID=1567552 RepID=A0A9P4X378_9HYPO|nr:hypothetical protein CFAM422_012107 [Trichoderma lentiforme]